MWPDLINQETGEVDKAAVRLWALRRATRDYGARNPPPKYFRPHYKNVMYDALGLRTHWRVQHGLPDDTEYTSFQSYVNTND
jgi:hypothetical protein